MPSSIFRSSLPRNIVAATVGIISIAAGAAVVFRGPITGVAPAGDTVFRIETGSGLTRGYCGDNGTCRFSGSVVANGVTLAGGDLTYADAQSWFIDDTGDTMTGALVVNQDSDALSIDIDSEATTSSALRVDVVGTSSAPHILFGYNGTYDTTLYRVAANELKTDDAFTVEGTMSGHLLKIGQVSPSHVQFQATASGTALTAGSGTVSFTVPQSLNGFNITDVHVRVDNPGITGANHFQIYNITDGTHVLSTAASIDSAETSTSTAATPFVINTANDDVNTNEVLLFGVPLISTGTAPQGVFWRITFEAP